jgi:hypothetical protein
MIVVCLPVADRRIAHVSVIDKALAAGAEPVTGGMVTAEPLGE